MPPLVIEASRVSTKGKSSQAFLDLLLLFLQQARAYILNIYLLHPHHNHVPSTRRNQVGHQKTSLSSVQPSLTAASFDNGPSLSQVPQGAGQWSSGSVVREIEVCRLFNSPPDRRFRYGQAVFPLRRGRAHYSLHEMSARKVLTHRLHDLSTTNRHFNKVSQNISPCKAASQTDVYPTTAKRASRRRSHRSHRRRTRCW